MQNKLEELKYNFEGFDFVYQEAPHLIKKTHKCIEVALVGNKYKIETDSRTFVVNHSAIEDFMTKVTFVGNSSTEIQQSKAKKEVKTPAVYVPETCVDLSAGLMGMFQKISGGNATKEDYEKAKSMSDIAGKIIDVEKVKLGYLALSKR
jgi:hypothetical protein